MLEHILHLVYLVFGACCILVRTSATFSLVAALFNSSCKLPLFLSETLSNSVWASLIFVNNSAILSITSWVFSFVVALFNSSCNAVLFPCEGSEANSWFAKLCKLTNSVAFAWISL
ncbi:hypothetical protein NWE60_03355 [Mycoplasmopsis felis]|nr:hypothetical protein [Mycoplasmopsis felis]WAM01602.1 hypothetical protein NWE60_03355 [Mycoplasmopsis felis]